MHGCRLPNSASILVEKLVRGCIGPSVFHSYNPQTDLSISDNTQFSLSVLAEFASGCAAPTRQDTDSIGRELQRELFLLPNFASAAVSLAAAGGSRRCRRRKYRLGLSLDLADVTICAPCDLGSRGPVSLNPGAAARLAAERVRLACVEMGAPPSDSLAGEGALCALLSKSSVHTSG